MSTTKEAVTACGRVCMHKKKINISTVMAGQRHGLKEVDDGIWRVTFKMDRHEKHGRSKQRLDWIPDLTGKPIDDRQIERASLGSGPIRLVA